MSRCLAARIQMGEGIFKELRHVATFRIATHRTWPAESEKSGVDSPLTDPIGRWWTSLRTFFTTWSLDSARTTWLLTARCPLASRSGSTGWLENTFLMAGLKWKVKHLEATYLVDSRSQQKSPFFCTMLPCIDASMTWITLLSVEILQRRPPRFFRNCYVGGFITPMSLWFMTVITCN